MSFSSAPDARTLGRVAGALAVDEAFVEKDWYVVQAICILLLQANKDITPIFSGGTALLKGYGLIQRFSEDMDFKLGLSPAFLAQSGNQQRKALGEFKDALVSALTLAGFQVTNIVARDANGFVQVAMDYPSILRGHSALRPHILVEVSAKPPALPWMDKPLSSFVRQYRALAPEVLAIGCIDPVETAADKLSAFTWRMLVRDRSSQKDDPAIVRHIHDLAAIERVVAGSVAFPDLLAQTMQADAHRGGGVLQDILPEMRLPQMLATLQADQQYATEYERFVEGMAFAGAGEVPSYSGAVEALVRLCALFPI